MANISFSHNGLQRDVYPALNSTLDNISNAQTIARNMDVPYFSAEGGIRDINHNLDRARNYINEYLNWSNDINHKLDTISYDDERVISDISKIDVIQHRN